ncbi:MULTISPECIES: XRE family transcriptional regulator [unclassified Pseudonocardia]|uniref:XRE family transcriptional regulator n=1 Tax=unclassified Pseudonocardia TaxID=2619320 RepID=UPI00095C2DF4|nr:MULTISPECIES: XRE family transcriptional regulator [unclassified Pseudonocardia]OLL89558.1 Tetratricopeptide TPR_4 [Pseudonocardia sp. Ae331_Ps2]OLM08315.1 Tetratricopeptide TPR_4 [Pseudonocardia sp. Ae505_Ps2]
MTESGEPRTLLEALIRQRQLTWDEAARFVAASAKEHEARSISLTPRHLARLARRERVTDPQPATARALQYAFGHPVADLLAPYSAAGDLVIVSSAPALVAAASDPDREVLAVAADRAQRFALNLPGLSDLSMEQVVEGVRDLAMAYPARPLPEVLGHLVGAQSTIFDLLERPQRPSHGRQLYMLAGLVGGMLAKASHDLGDPSAALTQSRTAFLCAEQADHHGLRAWISGLQSLVSYWANRPHESIRYAQRGAEWAAQAGSTSQVWLAVSEARAWGQLGNVEQVRESLTRADEAWSSVRPDDLDELGGLATFTRSRQLYYAADAWAWLPGGSEAESWSSQAVEAYRNTSAPDWAFGDAAGASTDLAIARIGRGELDGAREAVAPVLTLPVEQRIGGIIKSAQRVHNALVTSTLAADSVDLQEALESFTRTPLQSLPR